VYGLERSLGTSVRGGGEVSVIEVLGKILVLKVSVC